MIQLYHCIVLFSTSKKTHAPFWKRRYSPRGIFSCTEDLTYKVMDSSLDYSEVPQGNLLNFWTGSSQHGLFDICKLVSRYKGKIYASRHKRN